MAELGNPLRITREMLPPTSNEYSRERSMRAGGIIGAISLDRIIEDDNLPFSIEHMPLPVVADRGYTLLVPAWRVAAELATRAEQTSDKSLMIDASAVGSASGAVLVVPRRRVAIFEPL